MESLIDQIEIEDFVSSSGSQIRIIYCFGQKKPLQDNYELTKQHGKPKDAKEIFLIYSQAKIETTSFCLWTNTG